MWACQLPLDQLICDLAYLRSLCPNCRKGKALTCVQKTPGLSRELVAVGSSASGTDDVPCTGHGQMQTQIDEPEVAPDHMCQGCIACSAW